MRVGWDSHNRVGTVLSWHKQTGEWVTKNDKILTVQIEDEIEEVKSPTAGIITETCINEEENVTPGKTMFIVDASAKLNWDSMNSSQAQQGTTPNALNQNLGPSS